MPLIGSSYAARQSITGLKPWENFCVHEIDWATTAFATYSMRIVVAIQSAQPGESTIISAGQCHGKQSSACALWLPSRLKDNPQTTDTIYRSLVPPQSKYSMPSRRTASDLVLPGSLPSSRSKPLARLLDSIEQ